jgi:hypothetical protein
LIDLIAHDRHPRTRPLLAALLHLIAMTMKTTSPQLTAYEEVKPGFGWIDALVLAVLFGLLWSALHFGKGCWCISTRPTSWKSTARPP